MKRNKHLLIITALLFGGLLSTGCNGKNDGTPDDTPPEDEKIAVTRIDIPAANVSIAVEEIKDLTALFTVMPENATDRSVTFESEDDEIVTVGTSGSITGVKEGTAKVVVTSKDNASISGEFNVTVTSVYGDYSRLGWTLSIEPFKVFDEAGNSVEGPLDGVDNSFLGLVKPGKTHGGITNPPLEEDGYLHFIIDMKDAKTVNYFRIRHKNTGNIQLRWRKFSQISGSNDGENFTVIDTDVAVTGYNVAGDIMTPDISFAEATYRYLKFYANDAGCWDTASGNSVQMSEIYLGRSDGKPAEKIDVAAIDIPAANVTIEVGENENLSALFTVLPENATDRSVTYESEDDGIVTVSGSGLITGVAEGTAKVTVISNDNASVRGEFNVTITPVTSLYGDYSRTGWTVSVAPLGVFNETGNSLEGALDGVSSTFLGLIKPGKTYGGVTNPSIEEGGYLHFIIDMKAEKTVNYFRIQHKNTTLTHLRWRKFNEISGSNDGVNFTVIGTGVAVTGYDILANQTTPDISFTEATYRYLKFYANEADCWDSSNGSSVQMTEIFIGRAEK